MRSRDLLLIIFFFPYQLHSQTISDVRTEVENDRVIITYDLGGKVDGHYDISAIAVDDNGVALSPNSIVGDLAQVSPGKGRTIWWEPRLEGLTPNGWKISLAAVSSRGAIGIKWVRVEGGPGGYFYISATEITVNQYHLFCKATGHVEPRGEFEGGNQPVANVNVADAVAFCKWLSGVTKTTVRLPEEKEWEYAARGGGKSKGYVFSGSNNIDEVAWYSENSGGTAHGVASKKPNELGIYDMSENVLEWCGTSGAVRGGSCVAIEVYCRVSDRGFYDPTVRGRALGFRVLRER